MAFAAANPRRAGDALPCRMLFVVALVVSRRSDRPSRDLHVSLLCFGELGPMWDEFALKEG